ncbi:MAG: Do family serine endopeptidase [Bacteroidota bacterium]
MRKTVILVLLATTSGFAGAFLFQKSENSSTGRSKGPIGTRAMPIRTNYTMNGAAGLPDFTVAAEQTVHGVVHVNTTFSSRGNGQGSFGFDPFNFWGQPMPQRKQEASGSGVIISEDGYIITNNHVVENADKVEVTLNDNRKFEARIIGTDPSTDLALLKIDEKGLPFIPYGNSDELKVGEWVLAVGNPFNLTSTVTAGIVSAKGRNIGILPDQYKIESFIQTDAAVNPGNSGGALVNTRGELIGINAAIASNTGSYTGYSFAIPVNLARKVVDDLVEYGNVQRGFIGVSIRDMDAKLAEEKGLKETQGVYIAGLTEGGAAETAGLKEGDVIVRVGEVAVNSSPQLQEQVGRFRPGDKVNVSVLREGKEQTFSLVLRNREGSTTIIKNDQPLDLLGASFENTPNDDLKRLGIQGGVKVVRLSSGKLLSSGIKEGFIITHIDKKPVRSTEDLSAVLRSKQGGVLIEGIYPNGMKAYYGFGL